MGADVGGDRPKGGKKGGKKKAKRVSIRLDMTPMVDVAFLLLIFYMVTTVFRTPQALELTLPPADAASVPVAETKILTLRVLPGPTPEEPRIFWHRGAFKPEMVPVKKLGQLFEDQKKQVPDELITLIKIDRKANYGVMVRITDELGLAEIDKFSLAPLTEADRKGLPS